MEVSNRILNRGKFGGLVPVFSSGSGHLVRFPARNPEMDTPVFKAQPDSIYSDPEIFGCIAALGFSGCPSAVRWFVISVVINPIYRMILGWFWPHISQKILKTIVPTFAHRYAASTISMIFGVIWVSAPLSHHRPSVPLWRLTHSMQVSPSEPVYFKRLSSGFVSQTTATIFGFTKICRSGYCNAPAVANALPHDVSSSIDVDALLNCQATEPLANDIKRFRHNLYPFLVTTQNWI